MGCCIFKEWFRWKWYVLLVFIVVEYLVFNGVLIYNEVWVYYYVDFGVVGVFFIGSYLFYEVGVEVRGRGSMEDGNGIFVGEGEVV